MGGNVSAVCTDPTGRTCKENMDNIENMAIDRNTIKDVYDNYFYYVLAVFIVVIILIFLFVYEKYKIK